jgi:uncharacterized protein YoxC
VASVATPEAYSLTDSALIITIALLALLVGASLPVFYQLVLTLKSARRFFDQTGGELGSALAQIREAAARIGSTSAVVEESVQGLKPLTGAATGLGQSIQQLKDTVRMTSAVVNALGPATLAAFRALFPQGEDGASTGDEARDEGAGSAASGTPRDVANETSEKEESTDGE